MMWLLSVLSFVMVSVYSFQLVKWKIAWSKIKEYHSGQTNFTTKVSIIIAVRNEETNIEQVLNSLLQQHYPKDFFEVIVSDDESNDQTVAKSKYFFSNRPELNGIVIEKQINISASKKEALKQAIEIAKGELIITTDADCLHHPEWLQTMVSYYVLHQPMMICGPVLMKGNDSLLQQFQTMDYLSLQISGAASLALNKPLLCSGANLAFTRNAFYNVNGYDDNLHIVSGDDTFLMLKMNERFPGKVHFIKSQKAIVTTKCSSTLKEFLQQRIRWISKTNYYSNSFITTLGRFVFLVNFLILILITTTAYNPALFIIAVTYLFSKTIADYHFLSQASKFFNISINKNSFMLMELFYPLYLIALFRGMLSGSYQWKERNHNS